ncbi:MAG: hypothetical protein LBU51_02095 [Bacteroidales bacterium]|jgi:hypothetical protein|nr:hypothetical protein [Bacteroidales bacterium]
MNKYLKLIIESKEFQDDFGDSINKLREYKQSPLKILKDVFKSNNTDEDDYENEDDEREETTNYSANRKSSYSSNQRTSSGSQVYKVRLKGTFHLNGPKPFDRVVEMDSAQKQLFTGGKRKETMESWLKANYGQGAKLSSFTVQVVK